MSDQSGVSVDGMEQWSCPRCGRNEHDDILVMDDGIEVDVTCESVYFTFVDDGGELQFPGMVFDHSVFEKIIGHYERSVLTGVKPMIEPDSLEELKLLKHHTGNGCDKTIADYKELGELEVEQ